MTCKNVHFTLSLIALLLLSSCSFVMGSPTAETPSVPTAEATTDPLAQVETAAAGTAAIQTLIVQAVQETLTAMVTDTPQFTTTPSPSQTASETTTPTGTITSIYPTISVSAETNCRSGPGRNFDLLGVMLPGEVTEVIMRSTVANYWLVRNPDNPTQFCWLWGQYATVVGDTSVLPQATPPPTPTSSTGFTLEYLSTISCGGQYAFRVKIVNIGTVIWRSYKVVTKDATSAATTNYSTDLFSDVTGCAAPVTSLQDLEPQKEVVAGNWGAGTFGYNPAGHSITATFTLCTGDTLTGDCSENSISFTP